MKNTFVTNSCKKEHNHPPASIRRSNIQALAAPVAREWRSLAAGTMRKSLGLLLGLALLSSASTAEAKKIYWTDSGNSVIQRAEIDGSNVETIVDVVQQPFGIALDTAAGKMYWVDRETDKLQRADLDGTGIEDLVTNLVAPYALTLDLINNKVYWAERIGGNPNDRIRRSDLDGSNSEVVLISDNRIQGIALDVPREKIYFTVEDNFDGRIRRADFDGSNDVLLVTTGLIGVAGIALDLASEKMYWADQQGGKVQRADLDGMNVELVSSASAPTGIDLDLTNGKVYWVNSTGSGEIVRSDLDGSNRETLVLGGMSFPRDLALDLLAPDLVPEPVPSMPSVWAFPALVIALAVTSLTAWTHPGQTGE